MRKQISIVESKGFSKEIKKAELLEKSLKELNTKALNKVKLIIADLEAGDSKVTLGALDDAVVQVSDVITAIMKL